DIATGTGDFAFEALRLHPEKVIGVDISAGMVNVGKEKVIKRKKSDVIELKIGDSEQLEFPDESFDAITVGFGVRNCENLEEGLEEMARVLKLGGQAVMMAISKPKQCAFRQLYFFYFKFIMPVIGRIGSKDQSAYTYVPQSVMAFPEGEASVTIA